MASTATDKQTILIVAQALQSASSATDDPKKRCSTVSWLAPATTATSSRTAPAPPSM